MTILDKIDALPDGGGLTPLSAADLKTLATNHKELLEAAKKVLGTTLMPGTDIKVFAELSEAIERCEQ